MSSAEEDANHDSALQAPELLLSQYFDGKQLFISRLDVGKRVARWKKMKKAKRRKVRLEKTLRALQNSNSAEGAVESEINGDENDEKNDGVGGESKEVEKNETENIEGVAFFYGLPESFGTSKHISHRSRSNKRRYHSRSSEEAVESSEVDPDVTHNELDHRTGNDDAVDEPPAAATATETEPYQWKSWDEYYAYFYGCYGRYPTEQELQTLMTQSADAIVQSRQHLVFDEVEDQDTKGEEEANEAEKPLSKAQKRKKRKREREQPSSAPSMEAATDNGDEYYDDAEDYYGEEDYQYEEEEQQSGPPVSQQNLKYWYQRYSLFSKWDEGIELDEQGWYSVTPESIARHIAAKCRKAVLPVDVKRGRAPTIVVDGMCGPGGNSIQFASRFGLVISVDIDPAKIRLAKNNATVYGVQDDIDFIIGDFTRVCRRLKADVMFLSPPWGGPDYIHQEKFDLRTMIPDGFDLFEMAAKVTKNIAYCLPRNTDPMQMLQLAGPNEPCEIEQNYLNGRFKTITAYYGKLVDLTKPPIATNEEETEAKTKAGKVSH